MQTERKNLNRDWRFIRKDEPGAMAPAFEDAAWQRVSLPHTFDLPYFRTPEFYVGYGWYRKIISITDLSMHHRLECEGAFQVAEVYVNGNFAGGHKGGYTPFTIDLTPHLKPGENVLAIRVNNEWDAQLAPRAGEHIFSGGLYRDVYLASSHPVHFPWHGTAITTPKVSAENASVRVQTEVQNSSLNLQAVFVRHVLIDPAGNLLEKFESAPQTILPGQMATFDSASPTIARPKLWHPDHPHLHRIFSELCLAFPEPTVVDQQLLPFGFRWFEWTADRGFFLNGQHLYLRGANAHQDHSGWGIAITQAACRRDVQLMKQAGFNFVRGAHYPHHSAFATACDELGMIFWSENAFWGKGGFGPEGYWNASAFPVNPTDFEPFSESCQQQLAEMIRANRNHPSIVVWSMTNEAFFTYHLDEAKKLMADLVVESRRLDPTRPAAIGGSQRGEVDFLGDIAGYNGDGARLFINPGVPNMVSEYGAISKPHDAYDPFFGDLQPERFEWRAGEAIWCGFDYGSIAGRQGLKGICDHARRPKRSWHWYRHAYLGISPPAWPVAGKPALLLLSADKTDLIGTDATNDCQLIVTVADAEGTPLSNSPPVTLTIESGPGEFPTGRTITFNAETDIQIVGGQAAMAFRSYHGGVSVIRATSPGLVDATLRIITHGEPRYVAGTTPLAGDRPYTPPTESEAAKRSMHNIVNVALNRPCRASSAQITHPAHLANDGNAASRWIAADEDSAGLNQTVAWWMVDLEGFYQLSGTKITFDKTFNFRYVIELSQDQTHWELAVDRRDTVRTDATRNDITPPGAVARYVRVSLLNWPPAESAHLCEVEVHGVLSVR